MSVLDEKVAKKYIKLCPVILDLILDFLVTPEIQLESLARILLKALPKEENRNLVLLEYYPRLDKKICFDDCECYRRIDYLSKFVKEYYRDSIVDYYNRRNINSIYKNFYSKSFIIQYASIQGDAPHLLSNKLETLYEEKYDTQVYYAVFNDVSYVVKRNINKSLEPYIPTWAKIVDEPIHQCISHPDSYHKVVAEYKTILYSCLSVFSLQTKTIRDDDNKELWIDGLHRNYQDYTNDLSDCTDCIRSLDRYF